MVALLLDVLLEVVDKLGGDRIVRRERASAITARLEHRHGGADHRVEREQVLRVDLAQARMLDEPPAERTSAPNTRPSVPRTRSALPSGAVVRAEALT